MARFPVDRKPKGVSFHGAIRWPPASLETPTLTGTTWQQSAIRARVEVRCGVGRNGFRIADSKEVSLETEEAFRRFPEKSPEREFRSKCTERVFFLVISAT